MLAKNNIFILARLSTYLALMIRVYGSNPTHATFFKKSEIIMFIRYF
jgi:hypothetical protein